jgi:nucleotide-binding universal stress UspA family protein
MGAYQTVVVGTDGSESSLRAVDRAGAISAECNAKLIIAMAYFAGGDDFLAADVLKGEGYKMHGNAAIYAILHEARGRAKAAGAKHIEERLIRDAPVNALLSLAKDVNADLVVVGNVGLGTLSGRWVGSVPGNVSRRAKTDVLIVHTTDLTGPRGNGEAEHRRHRVAT